jgi:hypothetical protein
MAAEFKDIDEPYDVDFHFEYDMSRSTVTNYKKYGSGKYIYISNFSPKAINYINAIINHITYFNYGIAFILLQEAIYLNLRLKSSKRFPALLALLDEHRLQCFKTRIDA